MSSLQEMKSILEGIGHVLTDNFLSVPLYQRSYAWEERHVRDLLNDLDNAIREDEKEYFLGSIVITQKSETGNRPEVVDGQQRLATSVILIAAIRDYFSSNDDRERAEDIERDYLITRDKRTQELIPRLQLNERDNDFFVKTVLYPPDKRDPNIVAKKESHEKIRAAQKIIMERIKEITGKSKDPADELIDWIEYIETKARVISVRVPDYANAFTIFETLNDRGLRLAISDLLKNYLFHRSANRIGEAQQRWLTMTATLEAVTNEDSSVDFIRHLWSSKYGTTREKELYSQIKSKIKSKQSAIDLAGDLEAGSRIYGAILNTDHELWSQYGTTTRSYMSTINLLGMVQIRPLLLAILQQFDGTEVKKSFRLMVSWGVRFLISGGLGGGTLERHYCERAVEIRKKSITKTSQLRDTMIDVVPSDREFEESFATATVSKSTLARYYLTVLENQARGQSNPELVPNPNEEIVNLEHVIPLTPGPQWDGLTEDIAKTFNKRIGNLALLQSKMNTKAGNSSFKDKKILYAQSDFMLTSEIASSPQWGPKEVTDRQERLAALAVAAWSLRLS
jgi:hypothetical protein